MVSVMIAVVDSGTLSSWFASCPRPATWELCDLPKVSLCLCALVSEMGMVPASGCED